jgi:hypothetical protein
MNALISRKESVGDIRVPWLRRLFALLAALIVPAVWSMSAGAAVSFQAAGTAVTGVGAVSPAWPAHAAGDIALLVVESAGGEAVTLSTAAGFAALPNSPQATGAGTAGTRLTVFWARATSSAMTAPTIADPGDHVYARIFTYRGAIATGSPWDVTGGGVKATDTVTVTGVTTTVANTRIVQAATRDDDSAAASFALQTNPTLTGIAERHDAGTTQGNGGGFAVWDGVMAAAGATGNTTSTVVNSVNGFLTLALRPQGASAPTYQAAGAAVGGTGTAAPAWPAHAVNDIALLFVESAGGQPVTLTTPNGFVEVAGSPQFTGAGTAGTRLTVFWARATSTSMAAPVVGDPGDHVYARIITYRGVVNAGNPWDVASGGVKAAPTVTVSGVTTTVPGTRVVQMVTHGNDSAAASFGPPTNATLTGITERSDAGTTSGNGGGFAVWDGDMAAAGATGDTTATVVNSVNAFLTVALKPQPGPGFQAAGTAVGGTGTLSPTWPAHIAGDVALLFVESAGGQPVTLSTAAGFAPVTNSPQATGAGTTGTQLTVFWARATSSAMTAPTIADAGDHLYAQIITYRGVVSTGDPWDVTGGGVKATDTVTVTGVTTTVANTRIVQAVARDTDSTTASFDLQTNPTLTGIAEREDAGTTQGNGGGFAVWDGVMAASGATGNTTATVVNSVNGFLTLALRPQGASAPTYQNAGAARSGTGAVTPPWPAHAVNDIALLFVESAGGQPVTLTTPSGFVEVASSPQATGAGTAGTRLTVFWARATSTSMAAPVVGDPGDHVYARIITYRGVINAGNPWDVTSGGTRAVSSVTVSGVTTTVPSTRIVQVATRDDDSAVASFSAQTNPTLTGIAERSDAGTIQGNGGGFAVWDDYLAAAGSTGDTTATVVSSVNAFLTIALKEQVVIATPDHYELSLPTSHVACTAGTVTVTACANNSNPCSSTMTTLDGQTATLAVSTLPAGPACALGSTSVYFNAVGVATTTLNCSTVGDGATVTVTLSAEQTPATNARKCCQGGTCAVADSCEATNKTAGFIFTDALDSAEANIAAQRAGVTSATYYLRAIKTNSSTQACEAALSGANTVTLGYECNDPTTCSGSDLMSINGGAATTIARNDNGSVSSYTTVNMTFDGNGNAPFTLAFSDVGKTRLHAYKAAGGSLLTPLAGANANGFVTAPYDFLVVPAGPYVAGVSFGTRVTPRTSGGATTPSFGRETTAETVVLKAVTADPVSATNSQLVGPVGGQLGALTAGSFTRAKCVSPASSGEVCDTNLAWSEVGDLMLSAATANGGGYLGSGLSNWASAAAGPFQPAFLKTELDTAQPCGTFTYSGQPFRIKVSAMSAAHAVLATSAAVTQNYTGTYARAVTLGSDSAGACTPTTTGFSNNTLAATAFTAAPGTASTAPVTNTAAPLPITYAQALAAPSALAVCARDADGVNSHGQTQAPLAIRNGRLRLLSAYGSELLPIRVPVRTDYYSTTGWAPNADDSCTVLTADAIAIGNVIQAAGSSLAFAAPPSGVAGDPSLTLGAGTTTLILTPSTKGAGSADIALNMGAGVANPTTCTSWAAAPSGGASPSPLLNYLSGNTCGVGDSKAPATRVKFGSPKAPYIYLRERY